MESDLKFDNFYGKLIEMPNIHTSIFLNLLIFQVLILRANKKVVESNLTYWKYLKQHHKKSLKDPDTEI